MTAAHEPNCPKCGGRMWNNIQTKRNPKQPDFKCRDRECDGVIWPPKGGNGAAPAPVAKPDSKTPQAFSTGGYIPGVDDEPASNGTNVGLVKLFDVYAKCWEWANTLAKRDLGNDASHEGIAAQTATLLIAAKDLGLVR